MVEFSIITLTFNNPLELKRTIRNIINQDFLFYELIIINGGSNIESKEYLDSITDKRIRVISEKDNGIYDAMNKGLSNAKNDFIIFMNSGDIFFSKKTLSLIAKELNKNDVLFIYGDSNELDSDNNIYYKKARNVKLKITGMFTHHQSMVYSRKIIENNGIRYDTKYKIASDYDFTLNFLNKINYEAIIKINQPICTFSLNGISSKQNMIGFYEQKSIKKKYFNNSLVFVITILQYFILKIRVNYPWLYKFYRYK